MGEKNKIRVQVYFNQDSFKTIAEDAVKAGKRRGGLLLFTQKKNGFTGQVEANTDGISKLLKFCWQYWCEHETERLQEAAKLAEEERGLAERKKKLGIK